MDNTVTLTHPLETKVKETGEVVARITTVTIRPLKGGDLIAAIDASNGGELSGSLLRALIARSTEMSHDQVNKLELDDFVAVSEKVESFLPASLRTGATRSNSSPALSATPPDGKSGDQPS